jgi:hypothetical protein
MKTNKFGEIVMDEQDLCDLVMQGREPWRMKGATVCQDLDIESMIHVIDDPGQLITWTFGTDESLTIPDYDAVRQTRWFMPDHYKTMDIAEHVLGLCQNQEQLQRAGQELLMFQERELFDLLRYLKYLVDVMRENQVIWGVGRGSSVASYVLYLIGVHRVDSLYYDLDPTEFLR